MARRSMNRERVLGLASRGFSMIEIARRLSREEGRAVPYQANSVWNALQRFRRQEIAERGLKQAEEEAQQRQRFLEWAARKRAIIKAARDPLLAALEQVHGRRAA